MSEQERIDANLVAVATAGAQGERLAVVETELRGVRTDITDIKTDLKDVRADVKTLVAGDNRFQGGSVLLGRAVPWIALAVSIAVAFRGS